MDREKLRSMLLKEQDELSERVRKIDLDFANRKTSKQFDEQSIEHENDEVLVNLEQEAKEELKAIEIALARTDTKQFENCSTCSEPIGDARLEAIPHAITCIGCAV